MKKTLTIACAIILLGGGGAGAKKVLDHSSFNTWQSAKNISLSKDGEWSLYEVNPQEGDGVLTFYNTRTGKRIPINRGYKGSFTADSRWGVALVKPFYADSRQAKIEKKKGIDAPMDSLVLIDLKSGSIERIARVMSYRLGKDGGDWIAYLSGDTIYAPASVYADTESGKPLVARQLGSSICKTMTGVKDYCISDDGSKLGLLFKKSHTDSLSFEGVGYLSFPDTTTHLLDKGLPFYGAPVFDRKGTLMAFTSSTDSVETGSLRARLFLADLSQTEPLAEEVLSQVSERRGPHLMLPHSDDPDTQKHLMEEWAKANKAAQGETLYVNRYTIPVFSYNSKRLFAGVAPYVAPDDTTIIDFENPTLDIWRWDAPFTPPQELCALEATKSHTFPVAIDIASGKNTLLTSNPLANVEFSNRGDGDWALIYDPSENIISHQWDYSAPVALSLINVNNGEQQSIGYVNREDGGLSPSGKHVIWFKDRQYHVYDIERRESRCISESVPFPLWDEEEDHPMPSAPYGIACWSSDDDAVMVYDRFDIWRLDPSGIRDAECLTIGYGRKNNLRFRYIELNPEVQPFVSKDFEMPLSVFDYTDKRHGLATMRYGKAVQPRIDFLRDMTYTGIRKADNAQVYSWLEGNFSTSPEVWVCRGTNFGKATKLTDVSAQIREYSWGNSRLVKWYAYNGRLTEGVLYTPEDFDPSKKYPMLTVFYETNSEYLNLHYTMEPSWSWINYPFYVSRGYVVFVPDIHYTPGVPGEGAWNCVCSGVEEMCRRYPQIDRNRIGIDGQSWGGYQTAYLVTRTDMFACAGSGAPVANMTSAFGGIRWESGESRQSQYEQGQSRIGRTLWEAPELYIANSPVFHADRVKTPLLIMHNDADGAVPWYQGIEMFMALRRLHKPVWMLQYNSEAHNLKERRNRKDITVRLQQFFDHYLLDAPMPEWMEKGIPATRKGQQLGY